MLGLPHFLPCEWTTPYVGAPYNTYVGAPTLSQQVSALLPAPDFSIAVRTLQPFSLDPESQWQLCVVVDLGCELLRAGTTSCVYDPGQSRTWSRADFEWQREAKRSRLTAQSSASLPLFLLPLPWSHKGPCAQKLQQRKEPGTLPRD